MMKVTNVSAVPQRSVLRYPGGKTWLIPVIRQWLANGSFKTLVEPFAGGASVGLAAVMEGHVSRVVLAELDEEVAAIWQTVLGQDAEWLMSRLSGFNVTRASVEELLSAPPRSVRETAFAAVIRNRISHGGILATGAGWMRDGEAQKGILSRWYPATLQKRISDIRAASDRINFILGDGIEVMLSYADDGDTAFFIDPPYPISGRRLYRHGIIDHERLFDTACKLKGDFLMTYGLANIPISLAKQRNFEVATLAMKGNRHGERHELLIGRKLDWIRGYVD